MDRQSKVYSVLFSSAVWLSLNRYKIQKKNTEHWTKTELNEKISRESKTKTKEILYKLFLEQGKEE